MSTPRLRIGIIGIGAMGLPIARNLQACGHSVRVRDIRAEAEHEARALGMQVCESPRALAQACEIVIVVVVDAAQIESVLFGEAGVVASQGGATTVMLCSTIAPHDTAAFAQRLAAHAIATIDAPISGGPAWALAGTMSMMIAAPAATLAGWRDLLAEMADKRFELGATIGDAAKAKLVNNLLAGTNLVAGAEALALAERLGLDARRMFEIVNASSGASWIFEDRMARALDDDFEPRAAAHILTKDLGLATSLAARVRQPTPLADAALAKFRETVVRGWAALDDAAVLKSYRSPTGPTPSVPIIDVAALVGGPGSVDAVAQQIGAACCAHGFFYIVGHGIDEALCRRLESLSRAFFALSDERKAAVRMSLGGRAWRGWFPLGGELTSGRPDWKEGLYLGAELPDDDPRVHAGWPLHGHNLFPAEPAGLRETVLAYLDALTQLGHALMRGLALSLGLEAEYFAEHGTRDPLVLFRIFNYPSRPATPDVRWGVGEHTDYGLLTILRQDDVGGLEIKTASGWIAAPPIAGSFVCNIGDMLDRMTGGLYKSTPHRVTLNTSGRDRISLPFFFDPNFAARIQSVPRLAGVGGDDGASRWDHTSVHTFDGSYGEYLLGKVGKVFPDLKQQVLDTPR
jgi:isopenicillin N synthase-like dioxygenase/3-hydroxyisobutyrate dehydrogenase-like beta-hydroxyacid dehydrogenase